MGLNLKGATRFLAATTAAGAFLTVSFGEDTAFGAVFGLLVGVAVLLYDELHK